MVFFFLLSRSLLSSVRDFVIVLEASRPTVEYELESWCRSAVNFSVDVVSSEHAV